MGTSSPAWAHIILHGHISLPRSRCSPVLPEKATPMQNDQVQNPKRHDLEDDVAHHEMPRSSTCQENTTSDAQPTIEEPYLEMTLPMMSPTMRRPKLDVVHHVVRPARRDASHAAKSRKERWTPRPCPEGTSRLGYIHNVVVKYLSRKLKPTCTTNDLTIGPRS